MILRRCVQLVECLFWQLWVFKIGSTQCELCNVSYNEMERKLCGFAIFVSFKKLIFTRVWLSRRCVHGVCVCDTPNACAISSSNAELVILWCMRCTVTKLNQHLAECQLNEVEMKFSCVQFLYSDCSMTDIYPSDWIRNLIEFIAVTKFPL